VHDIIYSKQTQLLEQIDLPLQLDVESISDEQILHSAVGILRRDIVKLKISVEDYPKSQTTSRLLQGQRSVHDRICSKQTQLLKQIDLLCNCTRDPAGSLMTFVPGRMS
jgi:hypothetical protein